MNDRSDNVVWDAIVIGAGPTGSVAARELARRGVRTLLVEKSPFPRSKVCGGCLNANALSVLARIGLAHVPSAVGCIPLRQFVLASGGRTATLSLPAGVAVSRKLFDAALADEAVRSGVTFRSGVRATLGDSTGNQHTVRLIQDTGTSIVQARVVIVADGLNGRSANWGDEDRLVRTGSRIGAGVEIEDSSNNYPPGRIDMAMAAGGYVGLVRVAREKLDVAAALDPALIREAGGLGPAAETIIRKAGFPAVHGLADAAWKGTPALTRRPMRIAGPHWFAVGDAAGYVEPFTGEGMAWAMAGAAAVVEIAARGVRQWTDRLIREWQLTHNRIVGRRQWSCRIFSRLLRSPTMCRWLVAALAVSPGMAFPVLRLLNRPSRNLRSVS